MEFISENSDLLNANLLFKGIFSNIRIKKNISPTQQDYIHIPCIFSTTSRIIKDLKNPEKNATIKFPIILIKRTGYARAADRVNNINNEVKYELGPKNRIYDLLTPIPIDISYEVTIMSKSPDDNNLIASNFMTFMNNDKYVSGMHPKYYGLKFNSQVIMDDSISEEFFDEIDGTQDEFVTSTFNFTFKTYLFGGNVQAEVVPTKVLSSVTKNVLSTIVTELKPDEIDEYQKNHPNASLSASYQQYVNTQVQEYVENPDSADQQYDGFVPLITHINSFVYGVPIPISDYNEYTDQVDNYLKPEKFRDALIWKI